MILLLCCIFSDTFALSMAKIIEKATLLCLQTWFMMAWPQVTRQNRIPAQLCDIGGSSPF